MAICCSRKVEKFCLELGQSDGSGADWYSISVLEWVTWGQNKQRNWSKWKMLPCLRSGRSTHCSVGYWVEKREHVKGSEEIVGRQCLFCVKEALFTFSSLLILLRFLNNNYLGIEKPRTISPKPHAVSALLLTLILSERYYCCCQLQLIHPFILKIIYFLLLLKLLIFIMSEKKCPWEDLLFILEYLYIWSNIIF